MIIFSLPLLSALSFADNHDVASCKKDCITVKKLSLEICNTAYTQCRNICENNSCRSICSQQKLNCVKNSSSSFLVCRKACNDINIFEGCLNNTYKKGEPFVNGCDKCVCNINKKVSCVRDAYCNKNVSIGMEECTQAGGLYQGICNGPYFDVFCSRQKLCICQGNSNYTCPSNYQCLTDFVSPNKRISHTIAGWRDLLGKPLGDIGICAK